MSKLFPVIFLILLSIAFISPAHAQAKKKYSFTPEIGLWVAPGVPLGKLSASLNTSFGGGVYARFPLPVKGLGIDSGMSYTYFRSDSAARLHLVPMYVGIIYTLPIKFAMKFHIKADIGTTFVKVIPEKKNGWFPNFVLGVGGAFPTGRSIFIGVHFDYIFVYESYVKAPYSGYEVVNGHFIHFGISVGYKFGQQ